MSDKHQSKEQSGGVSINANEVTVEGDIAGRDIFKTVNEANAKEIAELVEQFVQIKQKIDARPKDPAVDKAEIKDLVEKTEQEVSKGDTANPNKVERWVRFLAEMAPDIFEVTIAALVGPSAVISKTIQHIAQKVKESQDSIKRPS